LDEVKKEILSYVGKLSNHITADTASRNLKRVRSKNPECFSSADIILRVFQMMSHYKFRLGVRRFLHECFDLSGVFNDSADMWDVYKIEDISGGGAEKHVNSTRNGNNNSAAINTNTGRNMDSKDRADGDNVRQTRADSAEGRGGLTNINEQEKGRTDEDAVQQNHHAAKSAGEEVTSSNVIAEEGSVEKTNGVVNEEGVNGNKQEEKKEEVNTENNRESGDDEEGQKKMRRQQAFVNGKRQKKRQQQQSQQQQQNGEEEAELSGSGGSDSDSTSSTYSSSSDANSSSSVSSNNGRRKQALTTLHRRVNSSVSRKIRATITEGGNPSSSSLNVTNNGTLKKEEDSTPTLQDSSDTAPQ